MIFGAVFLIGFSTLAFEVLLTRIFSIGQWNHLSFMVISIALFGFAASGTFLSILNARRNWPPQALSDRQATTILVSLYTFTNILAFIAVNNLPLDYFRLPVEPIQSLYVLTAFIVLSLPFFFSGLMVAFAYTRSPENTGLIYFATMCGSACGAVFPALLLRWFSEGHLVVMFALIPLLMVPLSFVAPPAKRAVDARPRRTQVHLVVFCLMIVCGAAILLSAHGRSLVQVKPSPYKNLSQVLQFPKTGIEQTVNTIRGRIDRVSSPYIRFAPGLSLRYMETFPAQHAVFKDGDNRLVLYSPDAPQDVDFAAATLAYGGYDLFPDAQKALLIMQNGGSAIACALAAGIEDITLVIEDPVIAKIISRHYGRAVNSHPPRSYLSGLGKRFDIIHVENWGTSIPGSAALNQNHLYTSDAFYQYLRHLTSDGLIVVSRRLLLPPADSLRLWASAYEGLKKLGAGNPAGHLAILRNWDTFVLLVSKQPLYNPAGLKAFATDHNFDMVFVAGMTADQANRFNQFDTAYHFLEISRLAAAYRDGTENAYFRSYLLDTRPQTDNRPFPDRFLKWPKVKTLYKTLGSRLYALLMSGEIVVAVVFIEALLVSGFLLFLPLFFVRRHAKKPSGAQVLYFLAVGAGFMFLELYFIKKYILVFGDPVISFTVVVAGVLIFSSFGGAWAQKRDKSVLKTALLILIGALLLAFVALDPLMELLMRRAVIWQYLGALLVLLPIGFLMGLPFPIGMRDVLSSAAQRAYAWATNGCASVLTSIVSAQIALISGIAFILGCAIAAYVVVVLSWHRMNRA